MRPDLPQWDALRERLETMVFATSVTEVARRIYGASTGATQAGRRSVYYWLEGRKPSILAQHQILSAVLVYEQEVQSGTASKADSERPRT